MGFGVFGERQRASRGRLWWAGGHRRDGCGPHRVGVPAAQTTGSQTSQIVEVLAAYGALIKIELIFN